MTVNKMKKTKEEKKISMEYMNKTLLNKIIRSVQQIIKILPLDKKGKVNRAVVLQVQRRGGDPVDLRRRRRTSKITCQIQMLCNQMEVDHSYLVNQFNNRTRMKNLRSMRSRDSVVWKTSSVASGIEWFLTVAT
jgi:hypothetical protein